MSDAQAIQIREALRDVLQSSPFRTTRQCQDLLTWVVERTLAGETDLLKERVIGCEVFGRGAHYDPSDDPVVRVRAAEVLEEESTPSAGNPKALETRALDVDCGCRHAGGNQLPGSARGTLSNGSRPGSVLGTGFCQPKAHSHL